jgi:hypothetical protein
MHSADSPVRRLVKLLNRGPAGALLRQRASPEELRAAPGAPAGLAVLLRVAGACGLPGLRTPGMCSAAGAPGVGLRVQRCVVAREGSGEPSEECETVFEGELPP